MRARVKETGEIIEVRSLYPVTYSRLDCNGRIREEYDEDELELLDQAVMVSIDAVAKWLNDNLDKYVYSYDWYAPTSDGCNTAKESLIKNIKTDLG